LAAVRAVVRASAILAEDTAEATAVETSAKTPLLAHSGSEAVALEPPLVVVLLSGWSDTAGPLSAEAEAGPLAVVVHARPL